MTCENAIEEIISLKKLYSYEISINKDKIIITGYYQGDMEDYYKNGLNEVEE